MTEDRLGACIFLQVHSDYVPELAAIVDAFRWLWSPQTAFCILRQKWLETKRWTHMDLFFSLRECYFSLMT